MSPAHDETIEIDPYWGVDLGDRDIWAQQIKQRKKKQGKRLPREIDLEQAITDIDIEDTMKGSSTITIKIIDPQWTLIDSGFFDQNPKDGKLDSIDINYPDDSRYWWRLTQVTLDELSGSGCELTLTFMERVAVWLMHKTGPHKANRAKKTRAEFLRSLVATIKADEIGFHCSELHEKQKVAKDPPRKRHSKTERAKNKSKGLDRSDHLKIKGQAASAKQLDEVETSLDVAEHLNASETATLAMLCAGIGESSFTAVMNGAGSAYGGVFQGNVRNGTWNINDTAGMARSFLLGGKGFQSGGAIHMAKQGHNPGYIATKVEASGMSPQFYGVYLPEAKRLLAAYGGASGGGGGSETKLVRSQYNLQIGGKDNPHENFWDGMNRLSDEVKWALFIDGDRVYYDSEPSLARQKPVATIHRDDPSVVKISGTWDERHIATECELELICDPFEFRAGQVFRLSGYGPLSSASTLKKPLPGRWLISEMRRNRYDLSTTFSLIQPHRPSPEPAAPLREVTVKGSGGGDVSSGNLRRDLQAGVNAKTIVDRYVIPVARKHHINVTPESVAQANARHGPTTSGGRSDHQGPARTAWAADMSNGSSPTPQMTALARELSEIFGIPWSGSGAPKHVAYGWQFQLIYKSMIGGNHFNHVHFGIHVTGSHGGHKTPGPKGKHGGGPTGDGTPW